MLNKKITTYDKTSGSFRAYLWPAVIFLAIIMSALLIVMPKYRQIGSLRSEIEKKEKKLSQLTVKSNYLKGLNQQNLTTRANYLLKVLPEEKKVPYLFSFFKLIAARNNLEVVSISVNPGILGTEEGSKGGLPLMNFTQSLAGAMSDVKMYLVELNKAAPLMVVESFSLSGGKDKDGGEDKMDLSLTVGTPYLYLPEEIGAIESPLAEMTSDDDLTFRRFSNLTAESEIENQINRKVPAGKPNPFGF